MLMGPLTEWCECFSSREWWLVILLSILWLTSSTLYDQVKIVTTVQSLVTCMSLVSGFSSATLRQNEAQSRSQAWQKVCISTHGDAGAEPRARLRAGSTDVVAHSRILAAGRVQVCHRPWTVSTGETSGPRRVGACTQTQRRTSSLETPNNHRCNSYGTCPKQKNMLLDSYVCLEGLFRWSYYRLWLLMFAECFKFPFISDWQNGQDVGLNHRNEVNPVWYSKYLHAVCIMHRRNIHVA